MGESGSALVEALKAYVTRNRRKLSARRRTPQDLALRDRLEYTILSLQAARLGMKDVTPGGWLRAVRQATGIPVDVLKKRLGVTKHEVFRLEKSESSSRIVLANLKRAAEALGCELVYGLVPRDGSLNDIAAEEQALRENAKEQVGQLRRMGWVK